MLPKCLPVGPFAASSTKLIKYERNTSVCMCVCRIFKMWICIRERWVEFVLEVHVQEINVIVFCLFIIPDKKDTSAIQTKFGKVLTAWNEMWDEK